MRDDIQCCTTKLISNAARWACYKSPMKHECGFGGTRAGDEHDYFQN